MCSTNRWFEKIDLKIVDPNRHTERSSEKSFGSKAKLWNAWGSTEDVVALVVQAQEDREAGDEGGTGAWQNGVNYMHKIYWEKVAKIHITGH